MLDNIRNRYHQLSLPAKATIWFTICNFILKGIGFITGPIFTRLLSTEEYGILSVFLSYEQLILILATWEIQLGAYQKGLFKYKDNVEHYTTATQALVNILTIGCFIIIFIFNKQVTIVTTMPPIILGLLFIYLLLVPSYNCWLNRQRKQYNYKAAVSVTLLYSIVNVVIPMAAIIFIDKTANIKIGFTLLGSSIICAVFFIRHANYWTLFWDKEKTFDYWKFNIRFEGPCVLHSLSFLILSQADRVMIGKMIGSSQAAFYSAAYTVASVVTLFQSSINSSLMPWRYQMLEDKNYKLIRVVTNGLLISLGTIILMFIMVVPELMRVLYTSDYYESIWCIAPISTSVFFMFLYSIFVSVEEYFEKTQYVVYVSVTCGMINIVLNYVCIGWFGYVACAYTTLFSYMLFSLGHYLFMKRIFNKEGIKESVVDLKVVLLVSVVITVASFVVTVLYDFIFARYAILAVVIIVVWMKREKIWNLMCSVSYH